MRLPEEEEQVNSREGLGKNIDRVRGPLGKSTLVCAICDSSAPKKGKKELLLQKDGFIKDALRLTSLLCQGCYQEVRRRKLAEGKTVKGVSIPSQRVQDYRYRWTLGGNR